MGQTAQAAPSAGWGPSCRGQGSRAGIPRQRRVWGVGGTSRSAPPPRVHSSHVPLPRTGQRRGGGPTCAALRPSPRPLGPPAPGQARAAALEGAREVAKSRPHLSRPGRAAVGVGGGRLGAGPRPEAPPRGPVPRPPRPRPGKPARPPPHPAPPAGPPRRGLRARPSCTCPSSRAAGTCAAAAPTCPATGSPGCSCPPRCRSGRASPPRCPAAGTS